MPDYQILTHPIRWLFDRDAYREFFTALGDALDESVLIMDSDASQIVACNHAFLLLSGYSSAEIESLVPAQILPLDVSEGNPSPLIERRAGHERRLYDIPLLTRDGDYVLVDLLSRPASSSGDWLLVTAQPSALRKQEAERKEVEENRLYLLTNIAERLADGSVSAIPSALKLSQKILSASVCGLYRVSPTSPNYVLEGFLPEPFPRQESTASLKRIPSGELWHLGQRPDNVLQKAARAAGLSALQILPIGESRAWIGILVAGWRDALQVPPDSGALLKTLSSLFHTALQLGTQQASTAELGRLAAQFEHDLDAQFEAIPDALLALDEALCVAHANRAAYDLLGYKEVELIRRPIEEVLVSPDDVKATLLDTSIHDRPADRSRATLHHRDGTPFPVRLRAFPLPDGSSAHMLVVLSDQTEREAIEEQAEFLSHRALLGEVTAIFAHEVRNPINNISMGVQLIASRLGKEHPVASKLESIRNECDRLNQQMEDVLFYARPLELKMERLDLADSLRRLVNRWEPRFAQASVECRANLPEAAPMILADPRALEQVLINLITNAIQAMPEGGTLSFGLDDVGSPNGRSLELTIADTGPGIPADQLDRIFDPFFSTKKGGTGLGLAISRRIVSAHKGSLLAESYLDAGTVFTLRIPIPNGGEEV